MDKLSKIGLVVSIGLLIAWFWFQADRQKIEPEMIPEAPVAEPVATPVLEDIPEVVAERDPPVEVDHPEAIEFGKAEDIIVIETDLLRVELSSLGGVIKSVVLKENEEAGIRRLPDEETGDVLLIDAESPSFAPGAIPSLPLEEMDWEKSGGMVTFYWRDDRLGIKKSYEFKEGSFESRLNVTIENRSDLIISAPGGLPFVLGSVSTIDRGDILGVDILTPERVVRNRSPLEKAAHDIEWAALKTTYFTWIFNPLRENASALEIEGRRIGTSANRAMLGCAPGPQYEELSAIIYFQGFEEIAAGAEANLEFTAYFGPSDYRILGEYGREYEKVIDFGFWAPISRTIIWALTELYKIFGSYGWAIIILTVIIKIILWPLTHKSTKSMKGMQQVQPLIAELKEKHKSDPKKLQAETMKLYKEHGINPMGGCLPMVLQIPILFAFFTSLRSAILLRKAPFWIIPGRWIQDLSGPDVLMTLERPLPILGNQLNILPILMGISFLIQQKYTPTAAATPEAAKQQKMMAVLMPVMFIFIFYSLPSGLNLYFLISNVLSLPQQIMAVRKK